MPEVNTRQVNSSIVSSKVTQDGIFILIGLKPEILNELVNPEIVATVRELVGRDVIDYLIQLSFKK